jgi:leucine-rich repeat protein SHOC2
MEDIHEIVERIANNKNIDSLNLSSRDITMLPPLICELTHLKFMYLNDNKLIFIPEIGQLVRLEELSLENNELTLIPESFENLRALKSLNLCNNPLKMLSINLFLCLQNLTILWLNNCEIMYLPGEIGELSKLERLGLKGNNLQELPERIGQLSNLKWLNIEQNQLRVLPDSFSNLKMLGHLNASDNRIENLPTFLFGMENINILLLRKNLIKKFDDNHVLGLSHLHKVDVRENPFVKHIQVNNSEFYKQLLCLQIFIFEN